MNIGMYIVWINGNNMVLLRLETLIILIKFKYLELMKNLKKALRYSLYLLLCTVKSVDFWMWTIFIIGTIFCYYYPRELAVYDNTEFNLDRAFAPMEWYFIWMMGVGAWGLVYSMVNMARD